MDGTAKEKKLKEKMGQSRHNSLSPNDVKTRALRNDIFSIEKKGARLLPRRRFLVDGVWRDRGMRKFVLLVVALL